MWSEDFKPMKIFCVRDLLMNELCLNSEHLFLKWCVMNDYTSSVILGDPEAGKSSVVDDRFLGFVQWVLDEDPQGTKGLVSWLVDKGFIEAMGAYTVINVGDTIICPQGTEFMVCRSGDKYALVCVKPSEARHIKGTTYGAFIRIPSDTYGALRLTSLVGDCEGWKRKPG